MKSFVTNLIVREELLEKKGLYAAMWREQIGESG